MTELVSKGTATAERFAELGIALAELHSDGVPTDRRHTVGDELAILEERLPRVAVKIPMLEQQIQRLMESARPVAEALGSRPVRSIHRDFYPDQIIAASSDLVLLDLDLYTMGDPALDVGNFVAHLREQGLRELGDVRSFRDAECAFVESYLATSSETCLDEVEKWTHLSLLRHVEISWRIEERRPTLGRLVASCEQSARALGVL
jgi:aminoglycoside phosphotransferase (APT) family kinase protein